MSVCAVQPYLIQDQAWIRVLDGNHAARTLFDRHYSRYHYRDGRKPKLFIGPGFKVALVTPDARAVFVWRKFKSADGQQGVNCAIFRNEGPLRSSDLIRLADDIAFNEWPGERHYTYVNAAKLSTRKRRHAEYCPYPVERCFIEAGWQHCGRTKYRKLHILERLYAEES